MTTYAPSKSNTTVRCQQCGHIVPDIFHHVAIECEHDMTEQQIEQLMQEAGTNDPQTLANDAIEPLQRANNGLLIDARSQFVALGRHDAALFVDDARHKVSQAMQDLKRALNHVAD